MCKSSKFCTQTLLVLGNEVKQISLTFLQCAGQSELRQAAQVVQHQGHSSLLPAPQQPVLAAFDETQVREGSPQTQLDRKATLHQQFPEQSPHTPCPGACCMRAVT